ncbi:MAG: IgGFc-binding protein [Paludibacteraceae bacterium]|nr:IgGFc-binding protein [Paludibacteraceae bacterium]
MKGVLTVLSTALLLMAGVLCALPQPVQAATSSVPEMIPSFGKDFWLTYMYNFGSDASDDALQLEVVVIPSAAGTARITCADGTELVPSATLAAGTPYVYVVPEESRSKVYNTTSATVTTTGLHIETSVDATVYMRNYYSTGGLSNDVTPVIASSALGTEYVVQTFSRDMENTEFAVLAIEDGTQVVVKFSNAMALKPNKTATFSADEEVTFTLNKGQVYQVLGKRKTANSYLSGTTVKANKNFALFNGGVKAYIPAVGVPNGDHVVEQAIPISAWGKRFIATPMHGIPTGAWSMVQEFATHVIVSAIYDDTKVYVDGSLLTTLSAGQTTAYTGTKLISLRYGESPKIIETSQPVTVFSYLPTALTVADDTESEYTYSEPSSALLVDVNRGVQQAQIYCWEDPLDLHYADVIVRDDAVAGMRLTNSDGVAQNISGQFVPITQTFEGYTHHYSHARLSLKGGLNILENATGKFVATRYSTAESATSEANATVFNLAPIAPVVWVDDVEVEHNSILEYCNRHPGVDFKAEVDYPHDSVRWYLGEGATSTNKIASHMYGKTVGEADTTHIVRFFVYHHSPINGIRDTDSVKVSLRVHPVYYDTLETWVTAKTLRYEWIHSSLHAFGLSNRGEYDLRYKHGNPANGDAGTDLFGRKAAIVYGKDATNPLHKWTNADNPEVTEIFDSLAYKTSTHGCDSMFYLKLHITQNIIMPTEYDTVCQGEPFNGWKDKGHLLATGHKMSRMNLKTDDMIFSVDGGGSAATFYNTDVAGDFELRDTLASKVYPYPDSIHVLRLHVCYKPLVNVTNRKDSLCEATDATWTVNYTASYADSLYYWLKPDSAYDATRKQAGLRRTTQTSFDIAGMNSLPDGKYKLLLQAFNDSTCESVVDEVPVVIKNQPSLNISDIAAQCYPVVAFEIAYTPTDAAKIIWTVDGKVTTDQTVVVPGSSPYTFSIPTTGWTDGTYTLRAHAVSALGCDGVEVTKTFQIYKQPTATISSVDSQCDNEAATTLKFTTADAATYNYYIAGATSLLATPVATTDGEHTISLDISMLNVGDDEKTYTLKLVANSATCVSDTATATFKVYPMPTATITSTTSELSACAPFDESDNLQVVYTNKNAAQIKWQLKQPNGTVIPHDYAAVGTALSIPKAQLTEPGNYEVKITGVKSAAPMNCEVLNPAGGEVSFKMYNPATVALGHIDSVCAGEHIRAPYSTEYADTYRYKVLQGSTEKFSLAVDSTAKATGTIIVPLLEAGEYKLVINATNEYGCGDGAKDTMTFTVNPLPTITNLNISNETVCENESTSCELTFTTSVTGNDTIIYSLTKGTTPWVSEKKILASAAGGKITLDQLDTLSTGVYTVTVTPKTAHGCFEAYATVGFTVHPQPDINLKNNDAFCYGSRTKLTVPYERKYNVKEFTYHLKPAGGGSDITSGKITSFGESFDIEEKIVDLPVGDYILYATALSDKNCTSENDTVTIKVNPMPTAEVTDIADQCDDAASTTVKYTTTVATKYKYKIDGVTDWSDEATAAASGSFTLDISSLNVGDEEKTYTLKFKAYTATCEIEAENDFKIYPLPVIKTLDATTPCEGESVVKVPYTATNASTFSYQVLDGETVVKTVATATVADGKINVDIDGLTTGGAATKVYTLSVTATSDHDCVTAAAKTATITLKAKPAVTLSSVTNTCAGTGAAITVAYTGLTANKLDYIVRKGGVDTSVSGTKTGLTPGVDGSFDISGAALEALAAGTDYEVEIIAQGDNGCPSVGVDQVKAFTIYPLPTVSVKSGYESVTVCEGREDAVFELTTSANASTYSYTTGALGLTATDQPVVDQKIKITLPKADLKDGDFTLTVTVKSAAPQSCSSVAATAALKVNNRPWLKINDLAAQCFPAESFNVAYTAADAAKIYWSVDGKIAEQTLTVAAPYSFTVNTSGWAAGTYTLRARPESSLGCDSAAVVTTFAIHPKPSKVTNLKIPTEPCKGEKAMIFTYNKKPGEATSEYWALDDATVTGTTLSDGDYCYRNVDVSALSVGTHKLRVWVENVTTNCESDPVEIEFTIHPLPEITLLKDTACCAGDATVMVRYESTNANSYTYTLTPGTGSGTGSMGANGYIEVNTAGLVAGSYTLTVTAQSEHGCTIATPKTATITINTVPSIKLSAVDDFCEGTGSVTINYTALTAATAFDYIVKSGTTTIDSGEKTGMAANGSFTINPSSWKPGEYTIELIAKANGCGSQGDDQVRSFTINPLPTISADETAVTLCEKNADAVFTFTTKHADTYSYWLSGSGAPTFAATDQTVPAGGVVTITWPKDVQKDGNFTLNVTAKNACATTTAATTTLKVNNKPEIISFSIDSRCLTYDNTVGYDFVYEVSADAARYDLNVWSADFKSSHGHDGNFGLPTSGTGTIHKSYYLWGSPLMAGDYKAVLKVRNDAHCESDSVVASFSVYPKPTLPTVVVPDVCQGKGTTEKIEFSHTYGSTYEYWIKGTDKHGTGSVTDETSGELYANIIDVPSGEHTLRLIVKSENGCASDTGERNFTIHPWPTWTWISTESSISAPYPIGNVSLKFKNTNGTVASGNWNVVTEATVNGGSFGPDKYVISGTIPSDSLKAVTGQDDGSFTIDFTGVTPGRYLISASVATVDGCGYTIPGLWITIYNPTSITINHIDSICKGETPVAITINTTYADTYSYVVKDGNGNTVTTGSGTTTNSNATSVAKSFDLTTDTWEAGMYTITVSATNSVTHATCDGSATFTINPIPEVTFTTPAAICENEVNSVNVAFTQSHAKTIKYHVDKLLPTPVANVVAEQEISANGTIALTTTGWTDGTYRIFATPTSQHGCVGDEKFTDLVVNNQPEAAITAMPTDVCFSDAYLNVTYTASTDARAYAFRILNASTEQPVSGYAGNGTIQAPYGGGSYAVDVHSLPVGAYKMELKTQTEPGCWSEASLQPFTVRAKPGATISKMESVCEGTATATAEYTTTNAATYYYTVKGTSIEGTGTTTGSGTISVDVSTLVAANSPYTLQLVSKSTYCESDTAEKAFAIWPIPVVTITSINDVCFGDATTTVTYSPDANVSSCTYTLKQGTTVLLADQPVTLNPARTFTINTSALAAETYTVELTPRSSHTCTGAMVSTTFKVNPLPTLGDITLDAAAVCEGTAAMGATFAHTGATSYAWELRQQGSATVLRSGNATGLVDATSAISIDLLAPSALEAGKTYDLKVVVKNDATDCEQTKTASFVIRKNPVVTLSPEGTHICQPVTEFKFSYTNEDNRATVFHYQVLKGTDVIVPMTDKMDIGASGNWTLPFGAELLQGEYKIHVTPANANCTGEEKILTFHVDTVMPSVTNATICYGETFDWVVIGCDGITPDTLMRGLTATTHQLDTLFCEGECVKVYELNLTAYPENLISEEQYTLCAGETYAWHGQSISKAGTYEAFEPGGDNGCDKVYRIVVDQIVPEQKSTSQTVCYGEPVIFNGKTYTNLPVGPQTLLDTIKSAGDCDSVYLKLNLTVGQRYYDSIVVTECNKYVWAVNGNTYNHSGIYREEMATVDGCDSVCVLNLTINPSYEFNETYDILNTQLPFTVHEFTYTAAGTYDREFVSVAGCDSIYHITLNVHELQLPRDTTTAAICAGATYTWQGNNYTAGGWYSVTENDGVNDVAIHVLHLNVNPTYSDTTYVHSCGTYNWRGTDYSASGIYPVLLPSSCGCDSTVVLKLTVGAPTASTVNVTACQYEPTTVGNRTFVAMANTSFTETLTNAAGCDSVVTYNVTVTPRIYTSPEDMYSFCEGESYTWHGHTYDKPGTYYDSVADANGCTTIIHTLILTQKPAYHFEEDVEVSELALPYAWVGHKADTLLRTNGDYYDRWTSQVTGCDSIYHIHFHVNWVMRDTVQKQGCESVTWSVNGHSYTYTESGLYSDTLFTDAPANTQYDVIHFCDVTVHPAYHVVDPDVTVCQDELPYVWRGQTYSDLMVGDNVRSINPKTVNGCDSTFTITIHVVKSFRDEQTYAACPSELPYLWHGQLLTVAGDYTDAHSSITGCDSTYVLHFSVKAVTEPDAENQIHCQGEQIQWHGLDFVANEPGEYAYYDWYVPNPECPDYQTYHLLNLTVGEVYDVDSALTEHVCQDQTFLWFNADRAVTQDNAHKLDDHTYVETFHYEEQTILGCDSLSANLTLYMHLPYEKTLEDTTVCNSYDWDGLNITKTGDYDKVYPLHGLTCADSVLHRHFTVLYSETETITEDVCESYYWDKTQQDYTESGTYVHSVPQMGGLCDKIYTLNLTVRKPERDTTTVGPVCADEDGFTWGISGKTYFGSTVDSVVIVGGASNGCKRVRYLFLTMQDSIVVPVDGPTNPEIVTCASYYTWNGVDYTESTVARYKTTSALTGCDSIIYQRITFVKPVAVSHNLEGCRSVTWNEETFTSSQIAVQDYSCDSIVTLNIVVNHPDTIYDTIQSCNSYSRNGQTYFYSQDAQQDFLCDSVVMLHITINRDKDSTLYVTAWDTYTWATNGETYTASTIAQETVPSVCGCDSVVTLNLIINNSESDEETQIACESYDWPWSGQTYTASGDYDETHRIDVGLPTERDSTRTLHLGIGHKKYTAVADTVCDNYVWHNADYTESGTYVYNYTDTCDNADTLHLVVYHQAIPVEHYDTACGVLTVNGHSFFSSKDTTMHLLTEHGCDSVVNYHLTILQPKSVTIADQACDSYVWEGTTYTKSGTYNKVLTDINGCDSVVTLNLSIFPTYNHEFDAVGCNGSYVWDNRIYDTEGDYVWQYTSVSGCDSTVTMHLALPSAVQGEALDTTVCDYIDWNGSRYTEIGSYTATFTSPVTGCDSVAKLHLNIATHPASEFSETAQERYTWGSQTYYASGDYEQRFATDACDSIVTLHLTITEPLPATQIADTACDAYTWDSETFYESGTYTRNFPTAYGVDSIVTLSLVITHDTAVSITDKLCGPYEWNGQTITETGIYTQVFERVSGCDSVVTLTLTLCESFETSFTATARDLYVWDGDTYYTTGAYTHDYKSMYGCDSIVTLNLTIISSKDSSFTAEACTQYAWADSVYTRSTIHSHIFPAANGCDSVVTMTLIIGEPKYTDLYDTVTDCSDPAYAYTLPWGGTVQHTGIYCDTLQSALTQCDSIIRLHLQWCTEPLCIDTVAFAVTDCEAYVWDGQTYATTGTYYRHYTLADGCDSISMMRLNILPKAQLVIDTTSCDSLYWQNTDTWYYQSGFYYDTLTAHNGCDSVIVLHAVIGAAGEETIDRESCDAFTINGETFTESGTYIQHLTTVTGCDSTLTINLTITQSLDTAVADTACDDYLWNGLTLTETGFYPHVLTSAVTGCDSVVDLHLIVYGSKQVDIVDTLHCDSIIWGDDYSGIDTLYLDGIYTKTFQSAVGCDSTVTMDLRLLRHDLVIAPDTQACDSFVWNGKVYFESDTYSDTLVSSRTGCDSITTMYIEINPTVHIEIEDSVPPPFYLWPTENDTIWESGDYVDTVPSFITGCDSITTLHLIMTDSIILDPQEPVRIDTFGYCPGDTMNFIYNLLKGHPTKYILIFDTVAPRVPDYSRDFMSVLDTTYLENHGQDSLFTVVIPELCEPGIYCAHLQLFDDFSSSEVYDFCIRVNLRGAIVSMWTDVIAINNFKQEYFGYQWYKDDQLIPGATKQYYSDGEDLYGSYRALVQLADSSWVFTCEEFFDLRTDSLELIAYPTPAPVGQPVTIKAMGILLEKLIGSRLTITNVQGLPVHTVESMTKRDEEVSLPAGLYIATIVTGENDDRTRTANVKFTVF